MVKIIYMGTPEFSVGPLIALKEQGIEILAVYTQPPKKAGRGKKLQCSAVHQKAESHGLVVKTPDSLKNDEALQEIMSLNPDYIVVAAYGMILPQKLINHCPCINIHASILPRWRGAAPIQRAILSGDDTTGVSIMHMDAGLDTGDVLLEKEIPIQPNDTAGTIHDALATLGADMVVDVVSNYDSYAAKAQEGKPTYAHKIEKHEAKIQFSSDVEYIRRQVRAFNPWPGAFFVLNDVRYKVFDVEIYEGDVEGALGEVLPGGKIICSNGWIHPILIQKQGGKTMSIESLLRGDGGFGIPA